MRGRKGRPDILRSPFSFGSPSCDPSASDHRAGRLALTAMRLSPLSRLRPIARLAVGRRHSLLAGRHVAWVPLRAGSHPAGIRIVAPGRRRLRSLVVWMRRVIGLRVGSQRHRDQADRAESRGFQECHGHSAHRVARAATRHIGSRAAASRSRGLGARQSAVAICYAAAGPDWGAKPLTTLVGAVGIEPTTPPV